MRLITRTVESAGALEIYVSALPDTGSGAESREMFAAVDAAVESYGAVPCRERVFVPEGRLGEFQAARKGAYNGHSERVPTDWLCAGGGRGPVGGIQVHAIR